MFKGFILNKRDRDRIMGEVTEKIKTVSIDLFEELDEVQKIIYKTPEAIDCSEVRKTSPDLELYCNVIQALEWYYKFLSQCDEDFDLPEICNN